MAAHRKYSEKFKCEAVKMTRVAGITIGQVAQELDINEECWDDSKVGRQRWAKRNSKARVDR